MRKLIIGCLVIALAMPDFALSHPGRTNSEGCHNDRKHGGYHCHGGGSGGSSATTSSKKKRKKSSRKKARGVQGFMSESVYFSSCKEARANGYSRMKEGEPGYSSNLDRDNDGIACE